jgi:hypothetical protein
MGAIVACTACGQSAPGEATASQGAPVTVTVTTSVVVDSQSEEACKVSNAAAGGAGDLSCNDDLLSADLGITVADGERTWMLFGDTFPVDADGWPGGADATGYFTGLDPQAAMCGSGVDLVTVNGVGSAQTCGSQSLVYAPDPVFFTQSWPSTSIDDFVFQPAGSADGAAGELPSNAAIPGAFEVPTGAFSYEGTVYTFYSGAPGSLTSPVVGEDGLPSVSYLTSWTPPSTLAPTWPPAYAPAAVSVPFTSAESRQVVSMVDYVGLRPPTPAWSASSTFGGKFVQIAPVVSWPYLYLYGTGAYRSSHVYLARLPLPEHGAPLAFSPYLSETPGFSVWNGSAWSSSPADAAPLAFSDDAAADVGELSVQQPLPGIWLMMYTPSLKGAFGGNVMVRWATSPSGPWSTMTSVLDVLAPASEGSYCCAGTPPGGCAGLELYGCYEGAPIFGLYAPYMLPYVTPVSGNTVTVWYVISGTYPYTTALMSFDVDIDVSVTVQGLASTPN